MSLNKLTLVVHPFFTSKPTSNKNLVVERGITYPELPQDPLGEIEDPQTQFLRAGWTSDEFEILSTTCNRYLEGINFAKDGLVVILRSPRFDRYHALEQKLIKHIKESVPEERLVFYPPLEDKRYTTSEELPNLGHEEIIELILAKTGAVDLSKIQIYAFGEILEACVAQEAFKLHQRLGISPSNKARILPEYSCAKIQDERLKQLEAQLRGEQVIAKSIPTRKTTRLDYDFRTSGETIELDEGYRQRVQVN